MEDRLRWQNWDELDVGAMKMDRSVWEAGTSRRQSPKVRELLEGNIDVDHILELEEPCRELEE